MNVYIIIVSDVIKILLYGSPARLSDTCKLVYLNEMCPLASQDKMCLQFITKKKNNLICDETYTIWCNSEVLSPLHMLEVWSDPQRAEPVYLSVTDYSSKSPRRSGQNPGQLPHRTCDLCCLLSCRVQPAPFTARLHACV